MNTLTSKPARAVNQLKSHLRQLFILVFIISLFQWNATAQVTLSPALPTASQSMTITYDATQGNAALTGESKVYMHSGVVISTPTGTDWNYVIGNWGTDDGLGQMTNVGGDTWEITITPSSYYSLPASENMFRLVMIFRNADGEIVGRATGGGDIIIDTDPEYYMLIDTPDSENYFAKTGESINITASSSETADYDVLIDDVSIQTFTNTTSIAHNVSYGTVGDRILKVQATSTGGAILKEKSLTLHIVDNSVIEDRPSGVVDGINYIDDNTVILSLLAPGKDYVHVTGDFNAWAIEATYQMKRTIDGERFWLQINGLVAGQEYIFQYIIDGEIRIADPFADKVVDPYNDPYIPAQTYPSLISFTDTDKGIASVLQTAQMDYTWNIDNFNGVANHKVIIYEILIRDFTAAHSYQSVTDSMQYLKDLGVNTLHLMPVNEFEGNESWGYNPSFFFAPDKYYGHKNDLKALIDEAHANGIAVIIDMVLNHAFSQNVMARMYWDEANFKPAADNPWFNVDSPNTNWSWGSDFDHESLYTQNFVDSVNTYWLTEYKVDGFRYDFTKGFTNEVSDGWDYDGTRVVLLKRMTDKIREVKPNAYIILEHLTDAPEETELENYGMLPWKRVDPEYKEVISGNQLNVISFAEAHADKKIVYMESHDEERIMHQNLNYGASEGGYDIQSLPTALDRVALGAAFLYTVPGPKMIWMFGEHGYDYSIDYNGRVGNKPLVWEAYMQEHDRVDLKNTVAALLNLRKNHPVFTEGFFSWNAIGETRRINITHEEMNVTIIGNFATSSRNISPNFQTLGNWYNYFTGATYNNVGADYTLAAGQWELFTNVQLPLPLGFGGVEQLNAPSGISATVSATDVDLLWVDNAQIETGYEIERSTTPNAGFALIATLGADATTYTDAALADDTYYYRVRAVGGDTYSGYTNESSATVGIPSGFTVYFYKPNGWGANTQVHHWNALPDGALAGSTWPGATMADLGGGWYSHTFVGINSTNFLFNDDPTGNQTADFYRTTDGWYLNGIWYDTDPRTATDLIFHAKVSWTSPVSVHYWDVAPNATPGTLWPGEVMAHDGSDWYSYTISSEACSNMIFNNNDSGSQTGNLYTCGETWYDNGTWSNTDPSCIAPDLPIIAATPLCNGGTSTMTITGNLNGATAWHIYTGSCGGTSIGSTASSTFDVSPLVSTTYYVRAEGGCVTAGSCRMITINMNPPDDATFTYAAAYLLNSSNPTPTISGESGGTFSSTAGLTINVATGEIDLSSPTLGTYTITYATAGNCPNSSDVIIEITNSLTWHGSTSTDWADASNWNLDALPVASTDVVIANAANQPVITSHVVLNDLDINASSSITINSSLTVTDLLLDGSLEVISGASFIPLGNINGSGSSIIHRSTTFGVSDGQYSVIGSPVIADSTNSLGSIVYLYDELTAYGADGNARFYPVSINERILPGDAYFSANTGDISFAGMPNFGNINVPMVYDEGNDGGATNAGFNLVSNPYTAAISYTNFMASNTDNNGTLYFWDDGGSDMGQRTNTDYITANDMGAASGGVTTTRSGDWDGYIRSMQGFFVKASNTTPLSFTPSMMVNSNNTDDRFFREEAPETVKIALSSADFYSEILVGFTDKATLDYDRTLDAYKLKGNNNLQLYAKMNDDILAIIALPHVIDQTVVRLGMDIAQSDRFTLAINDLENFQYEVFLMDNLTQQMINLSEQKSYAFEASVTENSDRFSLIVTPHAVLGIGDIDTNTEMIVYANNNTLFVNINEQIQNAAVSIYDLSGNKVFQANKINMKTAKWSTTFRKSGMYILTVQGGDKLYSKLFYKE